MEKSSEYKESANRFESGSDKSSEEKAIDSMAQEIENLSIQQQDIDKTSAVEAARVEKTEDAETTLSIEQVSSEQLSSPDFLLSLVENFSDKDWFSGDSQKEEYLLKASSLAIQKRLKTVGDILKDAAKSDLNSPRYQELRQTYSRDCRLYAEACANVGDELENPAVRNAEMAATFAGEALAGMSLDEGIAWTRDTMKRIDANNWQSKGLEEAYGTFSNKCREMLSLKLQNERDQILSTANPDPKLVEANYQTTIELATLFTDRGSDIDSDLCAPDWAAGMLREVLNFNDLALQHVEKNFDKLSSDLESPLLENLEEKRQFVLEKIASELTPEQKQNPDLQETLAIIRKDPRQNKDFTEISTQYSVVRQMEAMFTGEQISTETIVQEVSGFANEALDEFLSEGSDGMPVNEFESKFGLSLSEQQKMAYQLLADIEGYGWADFSDHTCAMIVEGTKIAAMVVAGVAIGIATGGAGFSVLGAALVGGVGMTATGAVITQQGFDDYGEALEIYGTDLAVNTATFGVGRYLQAGRAALQLRNAGLLKQTGGLKNVISMGTKGGKEWSTLINNMDDVITLGNRLKGGLAEGTMDYFTGSVLDASATTIQEGGTFLQNFGDALENPLNFGFIGVGVGIEFSPTLLKNIKSGMKNVDDATLHSLNQSLNAAKTIKSKSMPELKKAGISWKEFVESDWNKIKTKIEGNALLQKMHKKLKDVQKEFSTDLIEISREDLLTETIKESYSTAGEES